MTVEKERDMLAKKLFAIQKIMNNLLLVGKPGDYRPVKNTTKQECYDALGEIQKIVGTNYANVRYRIDILNAELSLCEFIEGLNKRINE